MSNKSTKIKANYRVVGVMSGTSLDGLDLALADFSLKNEQWSFETIKACTIGYPKRLSRQLAISTQLNAGQLVELDIELGLFIGEAIVQHFEKEEQIDFIASHGHTIFHQPQKGISLQIGEAKAIHKTTNIPVISDFRSLDVALGGNGAPLVPIGDQLLFSEYDCFLNLGGIANCTLYKEDKMLAYDIMPFNMALNHLSQKLGLAYDEGGKISKEGNLSAMIEDQLLTIDYYQRPHPKSLGFEDFEEHWLPIIEAASCPTKDLMHTYVSHAAKTISDELNRIANGSSKLLVTGGGAYHKFFIELLSQEFNGELIVPSSEIVEFKEAIVFGFLGVLRHRNQTNCLKTVTGAVRDSSSGVLTGF